MKDSGFLIGTDQRDRVATLAARQPDGSLKPESFEIPQRPEFFMGGGGAFSTPQDYLRVLQALLDGGALDRVRTRALFTQVRPFFDEGVVSLYGKFESGLYHGLGRL